MAASKSRSQSSALAPPVVQMTLVKDLRLDPKNPRLVQIIGEGESVTQAQLAETLWREMAVDEIAYSIAENGYFPHEPLFAIPEDGELVVIEGNRRLAAVMILLDDGLRARLKATDLPKLSAARRASLQRLPVIVASREDLWQYIGFKHVNGPQTWESFAKASYVAWVHNELGIPLDQIASQIGDRHTTVQRMYRSMMVLEQAEKSGVFRMEDRRKRHFSFSHLYTGLDYPGIQGFLGVAKGDASEKAPIPKNHLPQLGELLTWLYGSKSKDVQPIVTSQNPDLRRLDDILQTDAGTVAIRRGLPLAASHAISRGDAALFAEGLQAAKTGLQQARATLLSGFDGAPDHIRNAEEILELAESLLQELRDRPRDKRRKVSGRR